MGARDGFDGARPRDLALPQGGRRRGANLSVGSPHSKEYVEGVSISQVGGRPASLIYGIFYLIYESLGMRLLETRRPRGPSKVFQSVQVRLPGPHYRCRRQSKPAILAGAASRPPLTSPMPGWPSEPGGLAPQTSFAAGQDVHVIDAVHWHAGGRPDTTHSPKFPRSTASTRRAGRVHRVVRWLMHPFRITARARCDYLRRICTFGGRPRKGR